jgi:hypothetical protein
LQNKVTEFKNIFSEKIKTDRLSKKSKYTALKTIKKLDINNYTIKKQLTNNPKRALSPEYIINHFHKIYNLIYSEIILEDETKYITSIISYTINLDLEVLNIQLLLSDLNIFSKISHVQYLLHKLYLDYPEYKIILMCLPHNCIYYARLGFKIYGNARQLIYDRNYNGFNSDNVNNQDNQEQLKPPKLQRNISITNKNIKNINEPDH